MKYLIKQCDWEITDRCNLNCLHCIINKKRKELNTKQCFFIIDILKKLGCKEINFTGGEPLTRKDFFEILRYSKNKGIIIKVFTNGILVNKQNIKNLKKFVDYLGFSIEGLEKENNKIRGSNSFRKILSAIKIAKKENINFGIYVTISRFNVHKLEEFLTFIKSLNPMNISLNEIVYRRKARKNKKKLFCRINPYKIVTLVKKIFPDQKFRKEMRCDINPKKIFLVADGKFYLCTEIFHINPSLYIGKFFPQNFKRYGLFLKTYKSLKPPFKCPYITYASNNISINLLTKDKCWMVK